MEGKTVYADVGNKLDYAAYWLGEFDGVVGLEFQGLIRKYCVKDTDEMVDPAKHFIRNNKGGRKCAKKDIQQ